LEVQLRIKLKRIRLKKKKLLKIMVNIKAR
jgi:hypothetical protein